LSPSGFTAQELRPAGVRRSVPLKLVAGVTAAAVGGLVALAAALTLLRDEGGPSPALPDVDSPPTGTLVGAHIRPDDRSEAGQRASIESFEQRLGRRLDIDHNFYRWDKPFPTWRERWTLEQGRIPMISWNGRGVYASDVAAGSHNALIAERAVAVKALSGPVLIRWFWEMDGKKKAEWAESPDDYVAAWRRIRSVFQDEGATNARWVWCPNASAFADGDAQAFYPGPEHVEWICGDGYNWAPGRPKDRWRSFSEIFSAFYAWGVRQGKPMMVGEFGVQEREPGEKAAWLREAREAVKTQFPSLRALVYFDVDAEHDWRIRTSESAVEAFRELATDPWFVPLPEALGAGGARAATGKVPADR